MTRLVLVHEPVGNRKLNVVFVHGLGGDAHLTWAYQGLEVNYWPRRVGDVMPDIGIYALDYDATPSTWLGKAALSIPDRALSVLSYLVSSSALRTAPIVFVCHSLGGLVVKELLLDASEQGERERSFLENVRGVAFLATPHSGSNLATLLEMLSLVSGATPVAMDLVHNNPHLLKQRQRYQTWSHQNQMRHLVFREVERTRNLAMVVPADSADPVFPNAWAIPVEKNHFGNLQTGRR